VQTKASADTVSAETSIRRIVRVLRVTAQRTQSNAGISAAQLFVLEQLGEETLSLNELAARTLTDRTSVAAVVERLRARGLVERAVNQQDRRRASVQITAAGRRVLRRSPPAPMTSLMEALQKLPPSRLASLAASLSGFFTALGADAEPAELMFTEETTRGNSSKRKRSSS
jgi:DNA-binding MarR family transcriptional regulator